MATPKQKAEKKPTEYVVLRSAAADGPYDIVGNQTTHGQLNAKRAAAQQDSATGIDPEKQFYVAVPASSFVPQKPQIQMTITFISESGGVDEDVEEEEEEEVEEETEVEEKLETPVAPDEDEEKTLSPDAPLSRIFDENA